MYVGVDEAGKDGLVAVVELPHRGAFGGHYSFFGPNGDDSIAFDEHRGALQGWQSRAIDQPGCFY